MRSRFPHGAHVGGGEGTVLLYHDDVDLHFALFHADDFSSSDGSSHNTQSLAWQEKGSVKLKNGRTFGYLRESADELHLSINGREFDLCQGRIVVLHDDGAAEQMKLFPSLATTKRPAELAKLIAATRTACEAPVTFEKLLQQRDNAEAQLRDLLRVFAPEHKLVTEERQVIETLQKKIEELSGKGEAP